MTIIITSAIVVLGTLTVLLSGFVAFKFARHQKNLKGDGSLLTGALKWQLWAEAVLGFGTLCFAVAAHTGHLPFVATEIQSTLRLFMFAATALTTFHLWKTIEKFHGK